MSAICASRLGLAAVLSLWLLLGLVDPVTAGSPDPGPSPSPGIVGTGDPRSNGQGPGLVGSPLAILGGVILLGALAAGGTLLYLRVRRDG